MGRLAYSLLYIPLYRKLLYKAENRCIRRYTRTRVASRPSIAIQLYLSYTALYSAIQRYTLYSYTALYTIQPLQHPSVFTITEWLHTKNTSPKTGAELESKALIPNYSLRSVIRAYNERGGRSFLFAPLPLTVWNGLERFVLPKTQRAGGAGGSWPGAVPCRYSRDI